MKKRALILCLSLILMMIGTSVLASAAPTAAQIDFTARQGWGSQIAPGGDRLYYLHGNDIYSMNKTGGNRRREYNLSSNAYPGSIQAHGGYLYFIDNYTVYRFKPGASKPTAYLSNVNSFVIGGDVLYYGVPSGQYIKTRNLSTGKNATVLEGKNFLTVANFVQDMLVFQHGDYTGFFNPKTKENKVYVEDLRTIQARGSYAFWYNPEDNYIYRGKLSSNASLSLSRYTYTDRRTAQCIVSGDYFYIFLYESGNTTDYYYLIRQDISTGKYTQLKAFNDLYEPMLQPLNNTIWIFTGIDGSLMGYKGHKVSK